VLLLKHGAEPNVADARGITPLHNAAFLGHTAVVEHLLARGARVDAAAASGETPLMVATAGGHSFVVQELLRNAANCEITRSDGANALITALLGGQRINTTEQVVGDLIKNKANTNCLYNGIPAVTHALLQKQWHAFNQLIKHGADVRQKDVNGRTPLMEAACIGDDGLGLFHAAAVMNQNLRAHSGEGQRTGAADPTRGASDESGLS